VGQDVGINELAENTGRAAGFPQSAFLKESNEERRLKKMDGDRCPPDFAKGRQVGAVACVFSGAVRAVL